MSRNSTPSETERFAAHRRAGLGWVAGRTPGAQRGAGSLPATSEHRTYAPRRPKRDGRSRRWIAGHLLVPIVAIEDTADGADDAAHVAHEVDDAEVEPAGLLEQVELLPRLRSIDDPGRAGRGGQRRGQHRARLGPLRGLRLTPPHQRRPPRVTELEARERRAG